MKPAKIVRPLLVLLVALGLFLFQKYEERQSPPPAEISNNSSRQPPRLNAGELPIARAIRTRADHVQVTGEGKVVKILPDDTRPPRHQQFLLAIQGAAKTVKVAHNTDLAPKIKGLKRGDTVRFSGEYIWNSKGGVLHWTHASDTPKHKGGWLEVRGRRYR